MRQKTVKAVAFACTVGNLDFCVSVRGTVREVAFESHERAEGALFDERRRYRGGRPAEDLPAAEQRLADIFRFRKSIEGELVTYYREIDGYRLYGEPRVAKTLSFRVFPPKAAEPEAFRRKGRRQPKQVELLGSFAIQDRIKNKFPEKSDEQFRLILERSKPRQRRASTEVAGRPITCSAISPPTRANTAKPCMALPLVVPLLAVPA
jgi:hypothetical protein